MKRTTACALILCALAGCDLPGNENRMRQEAVKADPGFAETLAKHDELADRIALLERELALKRSSVDRQIAQLRTEFTEARTQVNRKLQDTAALLKPEQQRIDLSLLMAGEELKTKRSQRASLGQSISRLRKALQQEHWTQEDRVRMHQELDDLSHAVARLDQETAALAQHLRLLKLKKRLLRL